MTLVDSKFDDLSDVDIDSLIEDAIPKKKEESNCWGTSVLKDEVANFNFSFKLVEVFLHVVWWFQYSVPLGSVFNFNNKNVNTLITHELLGFISTCSQTMI